MCTYIFCYNLLNFYVLEVCLELLNKINVQKILPKIYEVIDYVSDRHIGSVASFTNKLNISRFTAGTLHKCLPMSAVSVPL